MLGELRALIEWSGYSLVAFHRAFCDNGPGKKISAEPKTAPRPAPATATGNLLVANQRAVVLLLVRLFARRQFDSVLCARIVSPRR